MKRVLNRIYRTIMPLLVVLCVLLVVLRLFGISVICVKGDSMMPTIQDGQLFIATKIDPNKIEREDIITARLETSDGVKLITKRVIGLPGQHICVGYSNIFVDGKLYADDYLMKQGWNDFGEFDISLTLGPDEFYLMGDNRENSWSGIVTREQITGRVIIR